jgi:hypothetical protein
MTRAWRDIAVGVLGIIAAGLLVRIASEPFIVDQNRDRLEDLENHQRDLLERIIRLEVRHEPPPKQHGHATEKN